MSDDEDLPYPMALRDVDLTDDEFEAFYRAVKSRPNAATARLIRDPRRMPREETTMSDAEKDKARLDCLETHPVSLPFGSVITRALIDQVMAASARPAPSVNAADFGMVPDGRTDNSAAVQAALDSVPTTRHGGFCPPG